VWFTVTCYPWDGNNEPTTKDAVLSVLIPTVGALILAATAGFAAIAAAPAAGTAAAALWPLLGITEGATAAGLVTAAGYIGATSTACSVAQRHLVYNLERVTNRVEKTGHYANGDWIHVRGGPRRGVDSGIWQPMNFQG
jgi:hypothetical protein